MGSIEARSELLIQRLIVINEQEDFGAGVDIVEQHDDKDEPTRVLKDVENCYGEVARFLVCVARTSPDLIEAVAKL